MSDFDDLTEEVPKPPVTLFTRLPARKCNGPDDCHRMFRPRNPYERLCKVCKELPIFTSGYEDSDVE